MFPEVILVALIETKLLWPGLSKTDFLVVIGILVVITFNCCLVILIVVSLHAMLCIYGPNILSKNLKNVHVS